MILNMNITLFLICLVAIINFKQVAIMINILFHTTLTSLFFILLYGTNKLI